MWQPEQGLRLIERATPVVTSFKVDNQRIALNNHPDQRFVKYLIAGSSHGF